MSDPIPKGEETEGTEAPQEASTHESALWLLPPEGLPEELLHHRLARLDTRKALADLCKSIPGLDEALLPRGIQADALTRKTGGSTAILKGVTRRILNDLTAWGAFRTAVSEQIPPETFEALEGLDLLDIEELSAVHTTEGLLLAALCGEQEAEEEAVQALISAWREENQKAEKRATEDARIADLEAQLERVKRENERLSFTSRTANERATSLGREIEVLRSEKEDALSEAGKAEEKATAAVDLRAQLSEKVTALERRARHLERILEGERSAYSSAAERLEDMHEELGRVVAERDKIRDALKHARFTDEGFGELLIRAVKNEVDALPNSLDATTRTAQLMEFMGSVLRAHSDLRESRSPGHSSTNRAAREENAEEGDPSPSAIGIVGGATNEVAGHVALETSVGEAPNGDIRDREPVGPAADKLAAGVYAKTRPTLSFEALGGAGEVGGSSHLLDFGRTRVLVDAGIRPDGRGTLAPTFRAVKGLDAAVITHAHLDHCGALPLLVRDQPDVPIYCTPPSAKLIASALNDHAAMGGGLSGGATLHEVKKRLCSVPFGKPVKVGDAKITLTESGHILGAASVLFETGSATVFHTGDISLEDHFSIPSARLPDVEDIDLLIMEATLADQKPQPFSESIRTMIEVINETTVGREGIVLIPTYALGQAQEIILGIKHYGKEYGLDRNVFIYVDGSVVTTSERLYAEQLGYMKPYLQHTDPKELFFGENIRAVANDDKARERILSNPCAIIASPVTMQGGASAFYRRHLQEDPTNAVILPSNASASYGASRAPGEEEGWRVEKVSFAAHCTQEELLGITEKLRPRQIILIHGSKRRISDLAYRLGPSYKIHTPTVGETVRTVLR
ncbi:MAG TPA: MBL fold metallo-hydrolase [Rubrobacteraceae bacterium]|nr:MBL fold metallo-hydrolase [Rubrobacteraceae bacterium]